MISYENNTKLYYNDRDNSKKIRMRSDNDVVQPSSRQTIDLNKPSSCSAVVKPLSHQAVKPSSCSAIIQLSSYQAVELLSSMSRQAVHPSSSR
jgi:hypothetical protein